MATQPNYKIYIAKLADSISSGALHTLNEITKTIIVDITNCSNKLAMVDKRKTITSREIQTAIRILHDQQLGNREVGTATTAVTRYHASISGRNSDDSAKEENVPAKPDTKRSIANRSKITLNPTRVRKLMRLNTSKRIGVAASVFLAGAVQFIIENILELARNNAKSRKHNRITNRDILLSVLSDEQLASLLGSTTYILGGGVK